MRRDAGSLVLSATDLSNFLNCRHRTALEMGEALGKRQRPAWTDPLLEALFARGLEHERNYVSRRSAAGKSIVDLSEIKAREGAIAATLEAMRTGAEVIVQGAVGAGRWYGRPDVLLRVDSPSALGPWSYKVADTKLAVDTRAGTIVQLGLYCDLLAIIHSWKVKWSGSPKLYRRDSREDEFVSRRSRRARGGVRWRRCATYFSFR
jgi:predicted RecB family nuclease